MEIFQELELGKPIYQMAELRRWVITCTLYEYVYVHMYMYMHLGKWCDLMASQAIPNVR